MFQVDFEYFLATFDIRKLNLHHTIKTTRTCKSIIQHLFSIGSCQNDNIVSSSKTIHLDKQLVESVGSLIVCSSEFVVSFSTDCINLVYEDDSWSLLLSILKEISNSHCSHTCKKLDELTSTH